MLTKLLLVALGGALGAVSRYLLASVIAERSHGPFPWSTLTVNVLGCLVIGGLVALAEERDFLSGEARLFLLTGILGSFTTFSTLGFDGFDLLRQGEGGMALLYLGGSLFLGLLAVWGGRAGVGAFLT